MLKENNHFYLKYIKSLLVITELSYIVARYIEYYLYCNQIIIMCTMYNIAKIILQIYF